MADKLFSELAKGAWSAVTAYTIGDIVDNAGSSYVCIANNTNQEPPNSTYWALLAAGGGDVVGPGSSTDNAVALFDGTTGQLIKDSAKTIGGASGVASLNASSKVVEDPANATATPTASKIPIADGSGSLDDWISSASDSVPGIAEAATVAETTTGTDTTRFVTPDGLAGSNYGKRVVYLKNVIGETTTVTTGDGKMYWTVPPELNGYNLVDADASVITASSSGTPTVQIHNVTQAADMLSTLITIDANEKTSYTAAAAPVIDANNDDVATGDQLRIDVDVAGTGTQGLDVILSFQAP